MRSQFLMSNGQEYPLCSMAWSGQPIVDACAVQSHYGHLLVLTTDGTLHGVDFDTGVCVELCLVELPELIRNSGQQYFVTFAYRLHASWNGKYAAIVIDGGREGVVVDVSSGAITMRLHGGSYHEGTVPFSACFLRDEERSVFVHRTAWNRLDTADPATVESLTERYIAPYVAGEDRPAHYLDYFHGRLHPSPDGSRLFDDGWGWQPVSVPRAWAVGEWLGANPWESEDGASLMSLTMRDDWNTPACWISEQHIALWGLADWDAEEFAEKEQGMGVRILNATESEQPADRQWPMEINANEVLNLFSEGTHLYVAADTGTTVWEIASGRQIAGLPGFVARLHDPARGSLVAIATDSIVELTLP